MATDMDHFRAAARVIPVRSLALAFALAALLSARSLTLGFDVSLGCVAGLMYVRLVMRSNERLLDGDASVGAHAARGLVRIVSAGAIPAFAAALGPWWGMLVYFAGFFLPYALFVLEIRRRWSREPREALISGV